MTELKYTVFVDQQGNRFVFPAYYDCEEHDRTTSWFQTQQYEMALGVKAEKEPFVVTVTEDKKLVFPRVIADLGSPAFEHGRATTWVIGGPLFDETEIPADA